MTRRLIKKLSISGRYPVQLALIEDTYTTSKKYHFIHLSLAELSNQIVCVKYVVDPYQLYTVSSGLMEVIETNSFDKAFETAMQDEVNGFVLFSPPGYIMHMDWAKSGFDMSEFNMRNLKMKEYLENEQSAASSEQTEDLES